MGKDLTELVFILDRSGSMSGLEKDTIGGFNGMIEKQMDIPGDVNVTTVLFDHEIEFLHRRVPIERISPMTRKEYFVRGTTALLDAVGMTISYMVDVQKNAKEENKANKVIFVITTDGYENSSREYTFKKVKSMIEYQKENYGWEFLFLGANIDAITTAARFGIDEDRASNYIADSKGTQVTYYAMNCAISDLRENKNIGRKWKEEVEKDYRKRKK